MLVEEMAAARDFRSVLKMRLLTFVSACGDRMIFAFEGDDDKVVYARWIDRIDPSRRYEPFVCGGKKNSRSLSCLIADDAGGLNSRVAIFVDRDFDDLNGFCAVDWLFMTDRYSVENYLVCAEVLESLLRDYFPLDGEPERRVECVALFDALYDQFLAHSKPTNFRLYVARKEGIARAANFAPRLGNVVTFSLDGITASETPISTAIPLEREPTEGELDARRAEFEDLTPAERFRGKFALFFFSAFLRALCQGCREGCAIRFGGIARPNVRESELTLAAFASSSPLPDGLEDFVRSLPN